jgi:hypothetical protein
MSWFSVDVEADGPIPGKYSMISFGAVLINDDLKTTFYGKLKPISEFWIPDALAVSGHSREETLLFDDPEDVMKQFSNWLSQNSNGRPIFVSDNIAFDWQFINYYFHMFHGSNPFGYSARRIGDLYCGLVKDSFARWKHLRDTKHTHHPVDDAKGNAEVVLKMKKMGLKIPR